MLSSAVLVAILAAGVTALLVFRALATAPWPKIDQDYDACALVSPDDFGVFGTVSPLNDLFDGRAPALMSHSVEPMMTSGELGESCAYSSKFGHKGPRFQVRIGPSMKELPDLPDTRELAGSRAGLESTYYKSEDDKAPNVLAIRMDDAIIEVSAIDFPDGLKGEGPKWSSGTKDLARMVAITIAERLVKRSGFNALPTTIAKGPCRALPHDDTEAVLHGQMTFSRSVTRENYDQCAFITDDGTELSVRVERGRPASTRPPSRGWDELDQSQDSYQRDHQVAVVDAKSHAVAYVEVRSSEDQPEGRDPADLTTVADKILNTSHGS